MSSKVLSISGESPPEQNIVEVAIARAKAWLAEAPGRSQGDIVTGTKYKRATINRFLNGTYTDGDQVAVAREVFAFLDREAKTNAVVVEMQPVETHAFKSVHAALDIAKFTKRIAVIYGPPGTGKTFAAQHYAASDPSYNLLLWTHYGMGSPKGFTAELWRVLAGKKEVHYVYPARMVGWILNSLRDKPRFIIINDAHRCRFGIYELACDIIEQANVGVAFVGHEIMREEITKLQRRDSETFDRVVDFANFTEVGHIREVDGKARPACSIPEIRTVAKQLLPDIDAGAVKLLADIHLFPSMRSVVNTCLVARAIQQRSSKARAADEALIKKAYNSRRPKGF